MLVRLTTVNGKVVRQGLENLEKAFPDIGRKRLYNLAVRVRARLAYTATKPARRGKYKRTFNLKESMAIEKVEQGYIFTIDAVDPKGGQPYGVYVLGDMTSSERQAWMHRGRWPTLRGVVGEELAKVPADVLRDLAVVTDQEQRKANSATH